MSTTLLVLLAIFTAGASVGALWFLRWQEQQRLERARQALVHTDAIGEISVIGEALMPWLSREGLNFLVAQIHHHHHQLETLKAPIEKRAHRGLELATQWQDHTPYPSPLPSDHKKAQELRNLLQRFNEYLKEAYKNGTTAANTAKPLLSETRILNIRLATTVYESRARGSMTLSNPQQAMRWYKKAQAAYKQLDPLPDALADAAKGVDDALQELIKANQESQSGTRLEEGAEALAAEDEAWKKKHF